MRLRVKQLSPSAREAGLQVGDVFKVSGRAGVVLADATHNGVTFRVNPRDVAILCPNEGCTSELSRFEVSRGYQCGRCTALEEGPL